MDVEKALEYVLLVIGITAAIFFIVLVYYLITVLF